MCDRPIGSAPLINRRSQEPWRRKRWKPPCFRQALPLSWRGSLATSHAGTSSCLRFLRGMREQPIHAKQAEGIQVAGTKGFCRYGSAILDVSLADMESCGGHGATRFTTAAHAVGLRQGGKRPLGLGPQSRPEAFSDQKCRVGGYRSVQARKCRLAGPDPRLLPAALFRTENIDSLVARVPPVTPERWLLSARRP